MGGLRRGHTRLSIPKVTLSWDKSVQRWGWWPAGGRLNPRSLRTPIGWSAVWCTPAPPVKQIQRSFSSERVIIGFPGLLHSADGLVQSQVFKTKVNWQGTTLNKYAHASTVQCMQVKNRCLRVLCVLHITHTLDHDTFIHYNMIKQMIWDKANDLVKKPGIRFTLCKNRDEFLKKEHLFLVIKSETLWNWIVVIIGLCQNAELRCVNIRLGGRERSFGPLCVLRHSHSLQEQKEIRPKPKPTRSPCNEKGKVSQPTYQLMSWGRGGRRRKRERGEEKHIRSWLLP